MKSTKYDARRKTKMNGYLRTLAPLLGCVCSMALPGLASAATVSVESSGPAAGGLLVKAETGETNTLAVSATSTGSGQQQITVQDGTHPLVAGTGCSQASTDTVTCETSSPTRGTFELGDSGDRVSFDSSAFYGVVVRGGDGDDVIADTAIGTSPAYGNQLYGDGGNDQIAAQGFIHGGAGNDRLEGGPGSDSLMGSTGNDSLFGREGRDELYGGNGHGAPVLAGADSMDGGPGRDTFADQDRGSATVQQINADTIVGGQGDDSVRSYDSRVADVFVDLEEPRRDGQKGEGDYVSGVENLYGGDGDDRLYGDDDENDLNGGLGDDVLGGRGGDDTLFASRGDDAAGGTGRDRILLSADATGYANCGSGKDLVWLDMYSSRERPEDAKNGARISKTCERAVWQGARFKPTPAVIRSSGLITFGAMPFRGERFSLTRSNRPYVAIARLRIPAGRFSVQLPRDLASAHKKIVRVKIKNTVIYRFRLGG
jgi:hypothetical protein